MLLLNVPQEIGYCNCLLLLCQKGDTTDDGDGIDKKSESSYLGISTGR
ncbi:MAG: hypothetical protein RR313_11715 [Anaerovoracaceae bacterium]